MTQLEDVQIIDLLFERSERGIDELNRKYGSVVTKTAANILYSRQDVEECVNDTWLGVWNSIPPHRPEPLVGYVCRIARNLAVSRLRRETAAKRNSDFDLILDEIQDFIPAETDVEEELLYQELLDRIRLFLPGLPYDDRYLFMRRYWYADSVRDIAAAMGRRENWVFMRLFRLREKLRKTLKKEGLLV